jgi:hypothetical protein
VELVKVKEDVKNLTKNVVMWGGTKDVEKTEATNSLSQLIIVGTQVEVYNRKLYKQFTKFDSNRDLFTRDRLHMNNKEKELLAKKIVSTIKCMLNKQTNEPICKIWKHHVN